MSLDWMTQEEEIDPENRPKLSEGGDFVSGYAGLWNVAVVWRVWDGSGLDIKEMGIEADGAQSFSSGSFYYFRNQNYEAATELCKALALKFGPKQVWRWEMNVGDWIGAPNDALERFGEIIAQEVGIGGYGGRDRNDFHMIALPSVVQSLALATGMIKETIYDYAAKMSVKDDDLTDDYMFRMLGGKDDWENSELWQARTKIWAALGEENARAYTVEQGNNKHDATSTKLMAALRLLYRPTTQLYARVMRVPHPSIEATNKDGNRLRVMLVTSVWDSKEAAEAAEGEEGAETTKQGVETKEKSGSNGDGLNIPTRWEGSSRDDWLTWLRDFLHQQKLIGKPKPIVMKSLTGMAEDLDTNYLVTPAEIEPWLESANK